MPENLFNQSKSARSNRVGILLSLLLLIVINSSHVEAATPLLKIETKNGTYIGKEIVHNEHQCWLMKRDGKLASFPFQEVTGFKKIASRYQPFSASQMRSQLLRELGAGMEVTGTTHYLVCAAPGHGKKYAELFDQLYRECHLYFSTRGFKIKSPEFPLVAIVFPTHSQFLKYAKSDGIVNTNGLAGYYRPKSNRIALFDPATSSRTAGIHLKSESKISYRENQLVFAKAGMVSKTLQETIIHEGTHQVAFNLGLHSRIAETPRWVVEGLATVFEHPESRSATKTGSPSQRLNRERFIWFGNYAKSRRKANSLESFIASDRPFQIQTLDAYSEAWAFSFFLMETRSSQYSKYLKRIAERPMLEKYRPEQRIKDFHDSLGTANKMKRFEAEFLEFIARL